MIVSHIKSAIDSLQASPKHYVRYGEIEDWFK